MSVIIVTVLFSVSNRFDKLRIFALRFRARSVTYVYVRALAGARRALNYSFLKTIRSASGNIRKQARKQVGLHTIHYAKNTRGNTA